MDCIYNSVRYIYDLFGGTQQIRAVLEAPSVPVEQTEQTEQAEQAEQTEQTEKAEVEVHLQEEDDSIQEDQELEKPVPKIVLRKWNLNCLKDGHQGSTSLIVGKRVVGKTTLAKHLADQVTQEETKVLVFSPVGAPNDYALNVYTQFNDKYESELIGDHIKNKKRFEGLREESVILLDDALYNPKAIQADNNLLSLMMNARGLKIHSILVQQYVMGLSPQMRANMDYVFLFREPNQSNKRKIYEFYAGMFPSYELFSQVFDEVTKNYGCMVIHNNSTSDKLEDQVFWYKVPI